MKVGIYVFFSHSKFGKKMGRINPCVESRVLWGINIQTAKRNLVQNLHFFGVLCIIINVVGPDRRLAASSWCESAGRKVLRSNYKRLSEMRPI
jgi:hypothetical protein